MSVADKVRELWYGVRKENCNLVFTPGPVYGVCGSLIIFVPSSDERIVEKAPKGSVVYLPHYKKND